jgi:3-oxoacyl-[acyl-carrier-protein] synthase-3
VAVADLDMVLMHQANKRINEYCAKALGIPRPRSPTTSTSTATPPRATIPLLWDECARDGRIKPAPSCWMVAFGRE